MVLFAVPLVFAELAKTRVSPARLQQAEAKRHAHDRARCLCAGLALDACLRTVGLREREVKIRRDVHGKPFLAEYPQLHFSISHSGEWAVCVLDEAPVGVDIERIRPINTRRLAKRCFGLSEAMTPCEFFDRWTRQESFLKATGIGLSGLHQTPGPGWQFRTYPLEGYSLTVCSKTGAFTPTLSVFSDGDIALPR